ncbi:MAG: molybdopterin converting factor subunit 1 [Chloroflexi bacterium]|nr:molybdopterin converting factor subunit 1 [Chloroflexota bacterium]
MNVTILFFATLKDLAGQSRLVLTLPDSATVADVKRALIAQHPQLSPNLDSAIAAINREYAFPVDAVKEGDEIAFFPPVSGGQSVYPEVFRLAAEPLDLYTLLAEITVPATGAVCVFSGMVRGETARDGSLILTNRLEYEAYEPMALAKMQQVAAEIRARWPLVQGIAIVQRVGQLAVGHNTILIACAAGHRDQGCFEAARYGIDRLKEIVPVWKKEIAPDGASWVEGHYFPKAEDRRS